jgi:hypothetical protein
MKANLENQFHHHLVTTNDSPPFHSGTNGWQEYTNNPEPAYDRSNITDYNGFQHYSAYTINSRDFSLYIEPFGIDAIEHHLLSLQPAFEYGTSCGVDYSQCDVLHRGTPLTMTLRKAICFDSIFYSTHPDLFPMQPTMEDRMAVAERFRPEFRHFEATAETKTVLELCDDIRALLIYTTTLFKLGSPQFRVEMFQEAYRWCKKYLSIEKETLSTAFSNVSLDDVMNFGVAPQLMKAKDVTLQEKIECRMVWIKLVMIDTAYSLLSSQPFIVDDEWIPNDIPVIPPKVIPMDYSPARRRFAPDCGRFTVFEGTNYGYIVDDLRELGFVSADLSQNADVGSIESLQFHGFTRKFIVFSRSVKRYSHEQLAQKQIHYHNFILDLISTTAAPYPIFPTLLSFVWGAPPIVELPPTSLYSIDTMSRIANRALFITFLHFNSAFNNKGNLFPLVPNGAYMWTSLDVMYACIRMLDYYVQLLVEDENPEFLLMVNEMRANNPGTRNPELPHPTSCDAYSVVSFSIVCTSTLVVFSRPDIDLNMANSVYKMIRFRLFPFILKTSRIWPGYGIFVRRLEKLLNDFPARN